MSVLNKIPFINSVLSSLDDSDLDALRSLMNGGGDRAELLRTMDVPNGNRTNITEVDKGVHLCSVQVGPSLYSGYLVYSDDHCVLLSFTDFQSLSIFDINVGEKSMETISEYLDINELRYIVNDLLITAGKLVKVQADDIDSESEPAGKVLVSDGEGGAEWGEAGGGSDVEVSLTASVDTVKDLFDKLEIPLTSSNQYTFFNTIKISDTNILSNVYMTRWTDASQNIKYNFEWIANGGTMIGKYSNEDGSHIVVQPYGWGLSSFQKSIGDELPSKPYNNQGKTYNLIGTTPTTPSGGEAVLSWQEVSSDSEVIAYEGTSLLPSGVVFEDWTLHRAIKDGNVLWFVLCGNIKNESGSSFTPNWLFEITLPSDISSHIYRTDGSTCNQAPISANVITLCNGVELITSKLFRLWSEEANKVKIQILSADALSNNASYNFDVRIPIFLDIGTVAS